MKLWNNKPVTGSSFDKVNIRRLYLKLQDNRYPPQHLKLSRRSRRRWRGKHGGLYTYPQGLLDFFNEAVKRYEEKHG